MHTIINNQLLNVKVQFMNLISLASLDATSVHFEMFVIKKKYDIFKFVTD